MIAIIDYDAGNIKSVEKALLSLGQEVTVTAKQDEILGADKIVLPGVGAFGDAMENLRKRQLDAVIREAVEKEITEGLNGRVKIQKEKELYFASIEGEVKLFES